MARFLLRCMSLIKKCVKGVLLSAYRTSLSPSDARILVQRVGTGEKYRVWQRFTTDGFAQLDDQPDSVSVRYDKHN